MKRERASWLGQLVVKERLEWFNGESPHRIEFSLFHKDGDEWLES